MALEGAGEREGRGELALVVGSVNLVDAELGEMRGPVLDVE